MQSALRVGQAGVCEVPEHRVAQVVLIDGASVTQAETVLGWSV